MKVIVDAGGFLREPGKHTVTLTGGYYEELGWWHWRIQERVSPLINFTILLTHKEHEEMLKKYWTWRKENNISWTKQVEEQYGDYTK